MKNQGLIHWLLRKMVPFWIIGAAIGLAIGYFSAQSESSKKTIELVFSVPFCLLTFFYFYSSVRQNEKNSYQWSTIERLGIAFSAIGAGAMSFRLLVGSSAGPVWIYGIFFLVAAFVIRPVLEEIGWKRKAEPGGAGNA
jgi:uncharacterized membrane protein YfcA